MNIQQDLGVQSYCFRGFKTHEEVAKLVKQCGLSVVELCCVHADFTDAKKFADVAKLYKNNGVRIVSIGVQTFNGDEKAERPFFECCKLAGAKIMTADIGVGSMPQGLNLTEKLANEYDINIAIHNHGGRHWLGSAQMLRHILKNTGKRIGLCLDTAWAMDSGENPIAMAEEFAGKLYGVHIKDFVFDRARKHQDVVVGTGNLDLKSFLATLKKNNFNGSLILEYEGDVNDPVPALKKCVAAVNQAM